MATKVGWDWHSCTGCSKSTNKKKKTFFIHNLVQWWTQAVWAAGVRKTIRAPAVRSVAPVHRKSWCIYGETVTQTLVFVSAWQIKTNIHLAFSSSLVSTTSWGNKSSLTAKCFPAARCQLFWLHSLKHTHCVLFCFSEERVDNSLICGPAQI